MQKLLLGAGVVAAVAAASALSYWVGTRSAVSPAAQGSQAPAASPPPGIVVEASKVSLVKLPSALTAVGSLRSDETVVLRPEIVGRVSEILFREGERVTQGNALARLDDSVQLADLERAKANHVLSKSKYERAVDLRNQGFISSQAKDEAENMLKVAEADLQLAKARLAKTEIRAPFSGTVGLRQVSVGEYITPGQALVGLDAIDPIKVDFKIPEKYLPTVHTGQSIEIKVDAYPNETFKGEVYAIDPRVDIEGRSIFIRAHVPNDDQKLRPGQFARVTLIHEVKPDALTVPEAAIVPKGEDQFVFKVVDGKAQLSRVSIGTRREGRVELVDGVAAGEIVITAGQLKIRDGAAVTVVPAQEPKA